MLHAACYHPFSTSHLLSSISTSHLLLPFCCRPLESRHLRPAICDPPLATRHLLPVTCYQSLATHHFQPATCYLPLDLILCNLLHGPCGLQHVRAMAFVAIRSMAFTASRSAAFTLCFLRSAMMNQISTKQQDGEGTTHPLLGVQEGGRRYVTV